MLRSREQRDARGRFTTGNTEAGKTLSRSEQTWALVEPAKREIVARTRADLALDDGSAAEPAIGLVENYAEARLLRESLWAQLVDRGGPVTAKGNSRRVLDAYWKASDRERDRAQLLGLMRKARRVPTLQEALAAIELPEDRTDA